MVGKAHPLVLAGISSRTTSRITCGSCQATQLSTGLLASRAGCCRTACGALWKTRARTPSSGSATLCDLHHCAPPMAASRQFQTLDRWRRMSLGRIEPRGGSGFGRNSANLVANAERGIEPRTSLFVQMIANIHRQVLWPTVISWASTCATRSAPASGSPPSPLGGRIAASRSSDAGRVAAECRAAWTAVCEALGRYPGERGKCVHPQAGREEKLQMTANVWRADLSPTRSCLRLMPQRLH